MQLRTMSGPAGRSRWQRRAAVAVATLLAGVAGIAGCAAARAGIADVPAVAEGTYIAFIGGTVIPMDRDTALVDHTILIRNDRIVAMGPRRSITVPRGSLVLDVRGQYLIPGLWDMHVHAVTETRAPWIMPRLVAAGITGVREMWGSLPVARALRSQRDAPVPRLVVAGHILDGPYPAIRGAIAIPNAAAAAAVVDSLAAAGADFIKTYSLMPRSTYLAVVAAANARGLPVAGHVPAGVRIAEASAAGHQSMEHLLQFDYECSTQRQELQQFQRDIFTRMRADTAYRPGAALDSLAERLLDTFDPALCQRLMQELAGRMTWQTPTLVTHRGTLLAFDASVSASPLLATVPEAEREEWRAAYDAAADLSPRGQALARRQFARLREVVGLMHRAGVPILAGSDIMNPFTVPGASLHDELELLVASGLSPYESLRTATYNPAAMLGATDSLGAIAPGRAADIVVLAADPRRDIRAVRTPVGVMLRGRWYTATDLDRAVQR